METRGNTDLEFCFYVNNDSESSSLKRLFIACREFGINYLGRASVARGKSISKRRFESADDLLQWEKRENLSERDLLACFADPDVRVLSIRMTDALGIYIGQYFSTINYLSIPQYALSSCRHPIQLSTCGEIFSGPADDAYWDKIKPQCRDAGLRSYRLFTHLIRCLSPSYASLNSEIGLDCPMEYFEDPTGMSFFEFYIKEDFIGTHNLATIARMYEPAYQEQINGGLYISSYEFSNPLQKGCNRRLLVDASIRVAEMIGSTSPSLW